MNDAISRLREAMGKHGLRPKEIIADGKFHRFSSNGKPQDKAGYYVLFPDGPVLAGAFGNWRGVNGSIKWSEKAETAMDPAELKAYREAMEAARKLREAALQEARELARTKAQNIWTAAGPASGDHPYLTAKEVKAYGLRVHNGRLVVPYRDESGVGWTLQFIDAQGQKMFLPDGRKRGCFHEIPGTPDKLYLAEGYATGASIHEATGGTVIVCGDAGNLAAVGELIREKHPDAKITICADDDRWTDGNPGVTKAR